jgi:hypothetical protein
MNGTLFSLIVTLTFLGIIILSSIKYGTGTYKYCNLTFQGFITHLNVAYISGDQNNAIVVIIFDVYKITDKINFIETYKSVTNLQTSIKFKLQESYRNSSIVNLYKNCEYEGFSSDKFYYFSDMLYLQGVRWQSILIYSIIAFLISSIISGFCILDNCNKKPVVIKYTSENFSSPSDMDPLSQSEKPYVKILKL